MKTPEQREERLAKRRAAYHEHRARETSAERKERRAAAREAAHEREARKTEQEREERRAAAREAARKREAKKNEREREEMLTATRARKLAEYHARRARETSAEREERLAKERPAARERRAREDSAKRAERLAKKSASARERRAKENSVEREERLAKSAAARARMANSDAGRSSSGDPSAANTPDTTTPYAPNPSSRSTSRRVWIPPYPPASQESVRARTPDPPALRDTSLNPFSTGSETLAPLQMSPSPSQQSMMSQPSSAFSPPNELQWSIYDPFSATYNPFTHPDHWRYPYGDQTLSMPPSSRSSTPLSQTFALPQPGSSAEGRTGSRGRF
jgi:hypothetical protein